jgi:hypothetical protein
MTWYFYPIPQLQFATLETLPQRWHLRKKYFDSSQNPLLAFRLYPRAGKGIENQRHLKMEGKNSNFHLPHIASVLAAFMVYVSVHP